MIRRHVRLLRLGLVAADALSAFLLFVLVVGLRFDYLDPAANWDVLGVDPAQLAAAYGVLWVASLWIVGLYRLRTYWSLRGEAVDILRAVAVAAVASFSLTYLLKLENISRLFVLILFVAQPVLTLASRLALRAYLRWVRGRGQNEQQVLIVGSGKEAREFAREIEGHTALGMRVIGYLAGPGTSPMAGDHPVLGTIDEIQEVLHGRVVDEVVICLPPNDWSYVEPVTRICADEGKIVRVAMQPLGDILSGGRFEQLGDTPLVTYLPGPDRVVALALKRLFDIVVCCAGPRDSQPGPTWRGCLYPDPRRLTGALPAGARGPARPRIHVPQVPHHEPRRRGAFPGDGAPQ